MERNYSLKQLQPLLVLAVVEIVTLVVSNIIVAKNFMLFGYAASASIIFPLLMIATDLISECYGYNISRWVSRFALVISGAVALIYSLIIALPVAPGSEAVQVAMSTLLGQNWVVWMFSSIAFLISTWVNDIIFEKMKQRNKDGFIRRASISTLVSAIADCLLFFIPLYLVVLKLPVLTALGMLPTVIAYQVLLKAGVEFVIAFPLKKGAKKLNNLLENEA